MAKKTTHRKPIRVIKKKAVTTKKAPTKKKAAPEVVTSDKQVFEVRTHRLVPTHYILNQQEIEELFTTYKVSPQNLPIIFVNDASLAGMDVKMGDIIRITRASPTAGTAVFFRRVSYE